jgi:hypothetical protein
MRSLVLAALERREAESMAAIVLLAGHCDICGGELGNGAEAGRCRACWRSNLLPALCGCGCGLHLDRRNGDLGYRAKCLRRLALLLAEAARARHMSLTAVVEWIQSR